MSFFKFLILENLYVWLIFGMLDDIFECVLNYIRCWLKGSFFTTFDMINPMALQIGKILLDNFSFRHFLHLFMFNKHVSLVLPNLSLILNLIPSHSKLSFIILMLIDRKLKLI